MSMLYKATRIGRYGTTFTMYKLRTMVENADKIGGSSTADDDPRITKLGKFLRKTKLDEIPQLINVLKGDMGLIGWRPEALEYLDTIPVEVLKSKPGIVGISQLWDIDEGAILSGKEDPDKYYLEHILPTKRELDLWYVKNRNIRTDIWILLEIIKGLAKIPMGSAMRNLIASIVKN